MERQVIWNGMYYGTLSTATYEIRVRKSCASFFTSLYSIPLFMPGRVHTGLSWFRLVTRIHCIGFEIGSFCSFMHLMGAGAYFSMFCLLLIGQ